MLVQWVGDSNVVGKRDSRSRPRNGFLLGGFWIGSVDPLSLQEELSIQDRVYCLSIVNYCKKQKK